MEDDVELWIGDYLPTIYEVAMTIHHYSKCYGTQKQQAVVHKYSSAVRKVWVNFSNIFWGVASPPDPYFPFQ